MFCGPKLMKARYAAAVSETKTAVLLVGGRIAALYQFPCRRHAGGCPSSLSMGIS